MPRRLVKVKKSLKRKNSASTTQRRRRLHNCRPTHIDTDIVSTFMTVLMTIKLYHWNTCNYAQHKATDELYDELNTHTDKFVESALGNNKLSVFNMQQRWKKELNLRIPILSMTTQDKFMDCMHNFLQFLNVTLEKKYRGQNDLLSIRDEIVTDVHKFLYLLSLK